jgi:N-acetylglutamate synthase-like GNAT family acetyltransferase
VYLAYVEGVEYPVATAGMLYMPDLPIALLLSSATLPDFRGYGIYTSLMARRLSDARQDGMEAAIIQAVRATSAPICRKLGFVEVMPMELYVGQAESEI